MSEQSRIDAKLSSDGKSIVLAITAQGTRAFTSLPVDAIGSFVVGLLGAAIESARKGGQPVHPFSTEKDQPSLSHYVQANGVALCDTDKPDVIGLSFAFGTTLLNIGLSREALKPLGSALLALTAGEQAVH